MALQVRGVAKSHDRGAPPLEMPQEDCQYQNVAGEVDLIKEFLQARGVSASCPRCNNKHWMINENPSPWAGLWGANPKSEFSLDAQIYPVTILMCTNCGFISPHSKHVFDEWLKTRPKT
jgi:hypothetical protein